VRDALPVLIRDVSHAPQSGLFVGEVRAALRKAANLIPATNRTAWQFDCLWDVTFEVEAIRAARREGLNLRRQVFGEAWVCLLYVAK
jgi:hypothetical protein